MVSERPVGRYCSNGCPEMIFALYLGALFCCVLFRYALLCFVCFLFCQQTCDMRCNKDTYSQSGCIEVDMNCMYLSIL